VIEDFRPFAESIEWQLGGQYLRERGNKAFLGDARPVPYLINNDGALSRDAAELLFISLTEAEHAGSLPAQIFTLEFGIGIGLFARYFLDAFQSLCQKHGKDYYDRLCYFAADRSEVMLRDAARHGIFAHHPGRYVLRVGDALQPRQLLNDHALFADHRDRPFQAVFLNYLLDCLPADVLQVDGAEVRRLHVRTCLARGADLNEYTKLSAEDLARCAGSEDPTDRRNLLDVFGLLVSEYAYHPVDIRKIPYGDFAVAFARSTTGSIIHNHGALQCLENLLDVVAESGFILINDYGSTVVEPEEHQHQRFSQATFIGVNFPLLKAYFGDAQRGHWAEPQEGNDSIHARLLSRKPGPDTMACFAERFSKSSREWLQEPVTRARERAKQGLFEAAAVAYRTALERQPENWVLLGELAHFLTFSMHNPKAGRDLARLAVGLNPTCSTELWNTLADALYELNQIEEAQDAYSRALRINPSDVQALYGLVWIHIRQKDYLAALRHLGEALALDTTGAFRERLLLKQTEILDRLTYRHQHEELHRANRITHPAPQRTGGAPQPSQERGAEPTREEQAEKSGSGQEKSESATPADSLKG
jgi:tetratricopeptide (TPR) repeat protein